MTSLSELGAGCLTAWLNALVPSLALTAAVWLTQRCVRRWNAATRYLLWWMVVGAVVTFWVSSYPRTTRESPVMANVVSPLPLTPTIQAVSMPAAEPLHWRWRSLPLPGGNYTAYLLLLAAAGALVQLLRLSVSYTWVRRLKVTGMELRFEHPRMSRTVRFLVSAEAPTPMLAGFFSPAVIIPASMMSRLTSGQLEDVLLHELAHLARRDDWTNLLGKVLSALFWFDPLMRWLVRRIETEREIACDDWAVNRSGRARSYASSLARIAELALARRRLLVATGVAEHRSEIGKRITRLLDARRNGKPTASRPIVAAMVAMVGLVAVAGTRSPALVAPAEPVLTLAEPSRDREGAVREEVAAQPAPQTAAQSSTQPSRDHKEAAPQGFIAGLAAQGYKNIDVEELIELRIHGVTPEYIAELKTLGLTGLTTKELKELRIHGVTGDYIRELNGAGLQNLSAEQLKRLRIHGVMAEQVREARKYKSDVTVEQIIRMKMAGVI